MTAGQGTVLGGCLEELGEVVRCFGADRIGVCLDSCHLHAAGHRLDTPLRVRRTLDALDHAIGSDRIHGIHLNDSRGGAGSRLDRHAGNQVGPRRRSQVPWTAPRWNSSPAMRAQ